MTVFDRIKKLSDKQGISVQKVATDLGFSENLFYQWKTSNPKSDRLEKVADYFDVSVDYLLGRIDDPTPLPNLKDEKNYDPEKEADIRIIQRAARNMNDDDRKKALELWKIAFNKAFEDGNNK